MNRKSSASLTSAMLLSLLCAALGPVHSQSSQRLDYAIRVDLGVTADETIKDEVASFLSRELRSLPNVKIDAERPDFALRVVAIATKTGYALSVLVTEPLDTSMLSLLVAECANFDTMSARWMKSFAMGAEQVLNLWLRKGPSDKLKDECVSVIAAFDSEYLEPKRKFREKVIESMNNRDK